jgi:hypothetical protein
MIWLGEIVQTVEVFGGKASYSEINAYIRTPKAALSGLKLDNYELHAIQKEVYMDELVKQYIAKQKPKEKQLIIEARKLIFDTIPDCDEFIKWGVLCYSKGKIYLAAMKDRIHVGFSIIGLSNEEVKIFEGSGKTARHIKIYSVNELEEKNIAKYVEIVNKKAGIPG